MQVVPEGVGPREPKGVPGPDPCRGVTEKDRGLAGGGWVVVRGKVEVEEAVGFVASMRQRQPSLARQPSWKRKLLRGQISEKKEGQAPSLRETGGVKR